MNLKRMYRLNNPILIILISIKTLNYGAQKSKAFVPKAVFKSNDKNYHSFR